MSRTSTVLNNRGFMHLILCFCSMVFLASCPGNGGSSHSGGATYTGGTAAPSSSDSQTDSSLTAESILALSTGGDTEAVIRLFETGTDGGTGSVAVSLSAGDIGLPDGGRVMLTITGDGGYEFSGEASRASDGFVRFTIPSIPSGSRVTVIMQVLDADGTLTAYGSGTKTVTAEDHDISVQLTFMQTTPEPPSVTVTITYTDAAGTPIAIPGGSTGLTVTASWTDAAGITQSADKAIAAFPATATVTFSSSDIDIAEGTTVTVTVTGDWIYHMRLSCTGEDVTVTAGENTVAVNLRREFDDGLSAPSTGASTSYGGYRYTPGTIIFTDGNYCRAGLAASQYDTSPDTYDAAIYPGSMVAGIVIRSCAGQPEILYPFTGSGSFADCQTWVNAIATTVTNPAGESVPYAPYGWTWRMLDVGNTSVGGTFGNTTYMGRTITASDKIDAINEALMAVEGGDILFTAENYWNASGDTHMPGSPADGSGTATTAFCRASLTCGNLP
ncbi:MAG: hypothetical protein II932_08395 [Treponema sp.]|nr:hypothetical protein [Treponema sp.]